MGAALSQRRATPATAADQTPWELLLCIWHEFSKLMLECVHSFETIARLRIKGGPSVGAIAVGILAVIVVLSLWHLAGRFMDVLKWLADAMDNINRICVASVLPVTVCLLLYNHEVVLAKATSYPVGALATTFCVVLSTWFPGVAKMMSYFSK